MAREADEIVWLPPGFEFLSGLPEPKRRRRLILSLQAFLDDSGTKGTGKMLFLGGLIGSAEALALVADAWARELDRAPSIKYFSAREARKFDGQFFGFSERARDERVRGLVHIIDRDDLVMTFCGVNLQSHKKMELSVQKVVDAKRHPYNQPYLMALLVALMSVGQEALKQKSSQKVEVIVDEHVIFRDDALKMWAMVLDILPKSISDYMPIQPLFRDDNDFVALQAADLLMGHARMMAEKATQWPVLEFYKLKVSPFAKLYTPQLLGEIAARDMERR